MEQHIISTEDIRRINARLMGKASPLVLSQEDEAFFKKIKRTIKPFSENPRIKDSYKRAMGV